MGMQPFPYEPPEKRKVPEPFQPKEFRERSDPEPIMLRPMATRDQLHKEALKMIAAERRAHRGRRFGDGMSPWSFVLLAIIIACFAVGIAMMSLTYYRIFFGTATP